MKNTIFFWSPDYAKQTGYEQHQEFESHELHNIIDNILKSGLNVMIDQTTNNDCIIIHVDDKWRFKQH